MCTMWQKPEKLWFGRKSTKTGQKGFLLYILLGKLHSPRFCSFLVPKCNITLYWTAISPKVDKEYRSLWHDLVSSSEKNFSRNYSQLSNLYNKSGYRNLIFFALMTWPLAWHFFSTANFSTKYLFQSEGLNVISIFCFFYFLACFRTGESTQTSVCFFFQFSIKRGEGQILVPVLLSIYLAPTRKPLQHEVWYI